MKRNSVWCFGLGVVLSLGIVGVGCSSSDSPSVDAGKRDGSAGKGGSTATGGSGGTGGSSATGGTIGTGGSGSGGNGSGGSASGGSVGSGGSSVGGNTGVGGSATGGSTGTGGSGSGGSTAVDAGVVDATSADATDVSINNDAAIDGASVDTGSVSLDAGAIDAAAIDTTIVSLDAEIDTSAVDLSGVDSGNPIPCSEVKIVSLSTITGGQFPDFGTKGNYCVATCDDITGWGLSNSQGRTLVIANGASIAIANAGAMPLPPKVQGKYTIFQVDGSESDAVTWARLYWWGSAATSTCEPPTGGFGLN